MTGRPQYAGLQVHLGCFSAHVLYSDPWARTCPARDDCVHLHRKPLHAQLQGSIVVYNLDPETTNEHLAFMFSKFGDVKEISQSPDRLSKKVVSFYDVRHAGAALKAMNRAEQLGKLPSHITPQQAASMAYIAGSSPSLLQLAALQLQHEHSQVGAAGEGRTLCVSGRAGEPWAAFHRHVLQQLFSLFPCFCTRTACAYAAEKHSLHHAAFPLLS